MIIYFASDHAGFTLKSILVPFVEGLGFDVRDVGALSLNESDDYPDYISRAAKEVSSAPDSVKAIIIGGSGQGEAILANKYPQVRAVVFNGQCFAPGTHDMPGEHEIVLSRKHNDANVLSLGARFLNEAEAKEAVKLWLDTPFSGDERHVRRLAKIARIETHNFVHQHG